MIKKIKTSLAVQISVFLLIMVVICAVIVGVCSYVLYRNDNIDANADRAVDIAQTTAAAIDAEQFVKVLESGEKNEFYEQTVKAMDAIKARTGVMYLYVLDANYDENVHYFTEGFIPGEDEEPKLGLGDTEPIEEDGELWFAQEMLDTIATGEPSTTDLYDSGDFGVTVSGFAPITDDSGNVVGVVGIDISVNDVMVAVNSFGLTIVLIIVAFCVVACIFSIWYMNRRIGRPIGALTDISDKMARGEIDVHMETDREDEIGQLASSFEKMADGTRDQAQVLEHLAGGDLTVQATPRSEADLMNIALGRTIEQLNQLFNEVAVSSSQVTAGSDQIANGAQILASGSIEQAATLQQFSAAINDVLHQSEENAKDASSASEGTRKSGELMTESMDSMDQLSDAMDEINASSKKISGIIKVVDDIAFQTNILALNAAVEAARAGQHGKGFAVVADEVRSLAAKSAEAAKETNELIEDNIGKVAEGAGIAGKAQATMRQVNEIAAENAEAMERINNSSTQQNQAIAEITAGIGDLSGVVQANSATAEESAAAAEEMHGQAQTLDSIVGRFKLRELGGLPPRRTKEPQQTAEEPLPLKKAE